MQKIGGEKTTGAFGRVFAWVETWTVWFGCLWAATLLHHMVFKVGQGDLGHICARFVDHSFGFKSVG
jgi:hypothetical protein